MCRKGSCTFAALYVPERFLHICRKCSCTFAAPYVPERFLHIILPEGFLHICRSICAGKVPAHLPEGFLHICRSICAGKVPANLPERFLHMHLPLHVPERFLPERFLHIKLLCSCTLNCCAGKIQCQKGSTSERFRAGKVNSCTLLCRPERLLK